MEGTRLGLGRPPPTTASTQHGFRPGRERGEGLHIYLLSGWGSDSATRMKPGLFLKSWGGRRGRKSSGLPQVRQEGKAIKGRGSRWRSSNNGSHSVKAYSRAIHCLFKDFRSSLSQASSTQLSSDLTVSIDQSEVQTDSFQPMTRLSSCRLKASSQFLSESFTHKHFKCPVCLPCAVLSPQCNHRTWSCSSGSAAL